MPRVSVPGWMLPGMRSHASARLPATPPAEDAVEAGFRARGERAPWQRVWSNGGDVTDENPAAWPWPWSAYYAQGWRPLNLDTHVCADAPGSG